MKIVPLIILCAACLGLGPRLYAQENDSRSGTYEASLGLDLPLALSAAFTSGIGSYLYSQMEVPAAGPVGKDKLLPWDRGFAGRFSETADLMSDVGALLAVAPLAIGGAALYTGNSTAGEFGTFSLMLLEAVLFQNGINLAVRSTKLWPRPYVYAESGKGKEKADKAKGEAYGSFFSGHTSAAFTVAVFTSEWFSETHPNSDAKGIVKAVAFSLAGFEGALRIAAGKHYPSDVIVGALVGTGISYGILQMHRSENKSVSFWAGPGIVGVSFKI